MAIKQAPPQPRKGRQRRALSPRHCGTGAGCVSTSWLRVLGDRNFFVYSFASSKIKSQNGENDGQGNAQSGRIQMRLRIPRRAAIKTAAFATTAYITAPYVRGAYAAAKLSIGFSDHWA